MTRAPLLAGLALGAAALVVAAVLARPVSARAEGTPVLPGLSAAEFERRLAAASDALRRDLASRPGVASARVDVVSESPDRPLRVALRLAWTSTPGDLAAAADAGLRAFEGVAEVRVEARDDGEGLVTRP